MIDVNKLNFNLTSEETALLTSVIRAYGNIMYREGFKSGYESAGGDYCNDIYEEEDLERHKDEELFYNIYINDKYIP